MGNAFFCLFFASLSLKDIHSREAFPRSRYIGTDIWLNSPTVISPISSFVISSVVYGDLSNDGG